MFPILRLLRAAAGSDRDLLERYVRTRDEVAFAELVRRYGSGVWAACLRLAHGDAEDAFQAVFLTLSRKAGTVNGSLPAWLHAVTRRVAANLRRDVRRRIAAEFGAACRDVTNTSDPTLREGLALLDEELAGLPEQYRAVLIACCLEGRSRDEAAAHLGWSEGQVKGRLERAREVLRTRLARRGVEVGGILLAAGVCRPAPALPAEPSPAVISLANGVAHAMTLQKLKVLAAVLALAGAAAALTYRPAQGGAADPPAKNKNDTPPDGAGAKPVPDDGSDILRACLAKSDLVVLGELTAVTVAPNTEAGFGTYLCTVKVEEAIKGKPAGEVKARLSRFEMAEGDKHPDLKKGGRCILFLKAGGANDPVYTSADAWFGVQRPGPAMARELKRLAAQQKPAEPAVKNRWEKKLDEKNLTPTQRLAYQQIGWLHTANLGPGERGVIHVPSWAEKSMLPTDILYGMGVEVLPYLAEALDDGTPTETVTGAREGSWSEKRTWKVNELAALLIWRIADRTFVTGEYDKEIGIRDVGSHPELAPAFRKLVVDWHAKFGEKPEAERKIADVTDPYFRNRMDAVIWLGNNKQGRAAVAGRVDAFYADEKRGVDSTTRSELSLCAVALGRIGDKASLPQVRRVCEDMSWRLETYGAGGMVYDLFQTYQGLAMLGEKAAAVKELERLLSAHGKKFEPATRTEYEKTLAGTKEW